MVQWWSHLKVSWLATFIPPLPHNLMHSTLQILGFGIFVGGIMRGQFLFLRMSMPLCYIQSKSGSSGSKRVASWGCQCSPLATDLIHWLCTRFQSCQTPKHDGSPETLHPWALQTLHMHGAARNCGRYRPLYIYTAMLHCPIRLHLQNTNSKTKVSRILRWW